MPERRSCAGPRSAVERLQFGGETQGLIPVARALKFLDAPLQIRSLILSFRAAQARQSGREILFGYIDVVAERRLREQILILLFEAGVQGAEVQPGAAAFER